MHQTTHQELLVLIVSTLLFFSIHYFVHSYESDYANWSTWRWQWYVVDSLSKSLAFIYYNILFPYFRIIVRKLLHFLIDYNDYTLWSVWVIDMYTITISISFLRNRQFLSLVVITSRSWNLTNKRLQDGDGEWLHASHMVSFY